MSAASYVKPANIIIEKAGGVYISSFPGRKYCLNTYLLNDIQQNGKIIKDRFDSKE